MLSDLSSLIKFQERIQEKVVDLNTAESLEGVLEGYLTKVFKVVNRAIIFLDFWIQNANESKKLRPFAPSRSQSISGPVLLQRIESPQRIRSATLNMHFQEKMALTNASDVECVQMDEKMPVELDTGNGVTSKPSHDVAQHERRTSSPQRTRSLRRKPSFLRHVRLPSWIPPSPALHSAKSDRSASDSLEKAHDRFLGEIGSFIGLHLQSRSSEDLVATTHKSLETGMEIVNILNEIWRRDRQQSDDIAEASQLMRMRLKDLASAAKELCNQSDPEDMPADTRPEEGRCLVAAATACVRSAGDCVTKAHQLLDRTGDFELDYEVAKDCATCSNHSASKTSPVTDGHRLQEKPSLTFRVTPLGLKPVSETVALASPIKMRNITHERPQTSPSPLTNGTPPRLWIAPSPSVADGEPAKEVTPTFSPISPEDTQSPVDYPRKPWTERERQESVGMSITGSTSTYPTSLRDSMNSVVSDSTRATTPDHSLRSAQLDPAMLSSFGSMASMRSSLTKSSEGEAEILEKTYAHELLYAKDGQIQGGTLRALVEKLTSSTATPDASFINAFYLTFRQFTNATELAKTLQERYAHVADSKERGAAARLRVCNFLKGWLEHHWDQRTDAEALQIVQTFAAEILRLQLPTAAQRLVDLCEKASHQPTDSNPAVSVNSKTGLSGVAKHDSNTFIPLPDISKGQLNISHAASAGKSYCSILDFEPLELARQLTLIDSDIFCAIQPDELLGLEFTKRTDDSRAIHVRQITRLATDLAHLVTDSILREADVKKRALVIKQWIKVARNLLELSNYDSLMAIICSLSSSMIMRLKHTWEHVPTKHQSSLDELKAVVDVSRNYSILRQRLANSPPNTPTLPFVGLYLTDLTFVDAGNSDTRFLPQPGDSGEKINVVNFDKHMRTARIIGQLQAHQTPYRLREVPELKAWILREVERVRAMESGFVQDSYRRSCVLEPKREREAQSQGDGRKIGPNFAFGGVKGKGMGIRRESSRSRSRSRAREGRKFSVMNSLGFKSEMDLKRHGGP